MMRKLSMVLVVLVLLFAALPVMADEEKAVTTAIVHVRESPNIRSDTIGYLDKNKRIVVKDVITNSSNNEWAQIDFNGRDGYISIHFVKFDKKREESITTLPMTTTGTLNVRNFTSSSRAKVIKILKPGETIDVLFLDPTSDEGLWAALRCPADTNQLRIGFASTAYLSCDSDVDLSTLGEKMMYFNRGANKGGAYDVCKETGRALNDGEILKIAWYGFYENGDIYGYCYNAALSFHGNVNVKNMTPIKDEDSIKDED